MRILFLDDDPARAEIFLIHNPQAVWVETVPDCIARLGETWDEVHLDHDLGGEQYVTHERDDCGMEVVRWLSLAPRPHLRSTRFVVHSHNPNGATMMGMQLMVNGYNVDVRPFGSEPIRPSTPAPAPPPDFDGRPTTNLSDDPFANDALSRDSSNAGNRPKSFLETLRYQLLKILRPQPPNLDPAILERIRLQAERRAATVAVARNSVNENETPPANTNSND